ncbi:hypothetical protein [Paraburkholderia sp. BR13444]|uniref:hypothetical protein n=1 Tax=Paraburkholderia sp. BR13444 TaxID=3236997 RepID=UPI0034D01BFA
MRAHLCPSLAVVRLGTNKKQQRKKDAKSEEQPGLYETKAGRKPTWKKNHPEEDDVRAVSSRRLSSCR